ncbi:MAG: homocysteine biosynthesis protein [Deltaproteobacteria bacterium]|nr:homocysteine biosynthesis protein [Deltaproteobacteria bacterium]MBW2137789.1 homocysteine biosynthesis protein [Deltaproteobacteria bacterium]
MAKKKLYRSIKEINRKIEQGKAVVVTADEMARIVKEMGPEKAATEVDVVTTGTFAPMCSSGAFINFGHTKPTIKASKVWLNDVPAYAGLAAVDIYIGATEPAEDDPLNRVHPGQFKYGGGHVIEDLVAGKKVRLRAVAYGTDCYPNRKVEKKISLSELPYAVLLNPRNAYQNYNCAINLSEKTKYTYMGVLKPRAGNASYSTSGQLSPLFNDPYYLTIGMGTKVFLGGAQGYVVGPGTQHNPGVKREKNGVPKAPAGTLMVMGNLKEMSPKWLIGVRMLGYGCSLAVGFGLPIPILNEEMARYTGVSDEDIVTQIVDYGEDYPKGEPVPLGYVNYAELKSGAIKFNGQDVPTVPLSSYVKALEIAKILKGWIEQGRFFLTEPQVMLPTAERKS